MAREFEEIGHSGGQVTFSIKEDEEGRLSYSVRFSSSRPVPVVLMTLYALPEGIPIAVVKMTGIGGASTPPPVPSGLLVILASDSHGLFGHSCPRCDQYWRSGPYAGACPYCNHRDSTVNFLSDAQRRYVEHYCKVLTEAIGEGALGEIVIDMDEVADAVRDPANRPSFYVSEQSQQHKFKCQACGEYNDIIGTFGYCSVCATRNDLATFEDTTLPSIRDRLSGGGSPEAAIKDAVGAFDTFVAQYCRQLATLVPMTRRRHQRLSRGRFHDLEEVVSLLREWMDIDLTAGFKNPDLGFAKLMFHRRHVYEHNGGEADEKYLRDSGELGVRLKQRLHNTEEEAHRLIGLLLRLARNLHRQFHGIIPVIEEPIARWTERQGRRTAQSPSGA